MRSSLNVITILCLCSKTVLALDKFPEKYVVGRKGSSITLSCDNAPNMKVTWTLDDQDLEEDKDLIKFEGNNVTLMKLDNDLTGNFTCWRDGKKVNDTFVLLDMSDTITGSPVSCMAETFNCTSTISCSISEKGYIDFRLWDESNNLLNRTTKWIFKLTHTTNPFAEEVKPIVVFGEAVSGLKNYFKTRYSFYIRDIIRPGCPRVSVLKKSPGDVLDVNPPDTWTLPLSYYPLQHEIQFQQRTDGTILSIFLSPNNTESTGRRVAVPPGTSKLRARCRDFLLLSQWSEWTQWQNVGKRRPKNVRKRKKKDKKKKRTRADQI
ncbi:interleukin-12 subunit beta [Tachysurus fulvidraco]|uniref:interleukin-12 subunit beta n=1 Tax=Tachysurus fulvidraco TaxID=1234273 RepID=UPI001FEEE8AC|nr:interleukin-12 subunit beta [Tachysurus fulvidraco]